MSFGISRSSSNSKRTRLSSVNGAFRTSNIGTGGGSGGGGYATGGAMGTGDDGQEARVGSLETTVGGHATQIGSLETTVGGHVSRIGTAESTIATHGTVVTRNIAAGSVIANTDIYDVASVNQVLTAAEVASDAKFAAAEVASDAKFAAKQDSLTTSSILNIARTTYESAVAGDAAITANATQSVVNNFRLANCKLTGTDYLDASTTGGVGRIGAHTDNAYLNNFRILFCKLVGTDYLDVACSGGGYASTPVGVGRIGASQAAYIKNFRIQECYMFYQDVFTVKAGVNGQADGEIRSNSGSIAQLKNFKLVGCVESNGAVISDDRLKHNESSISNALDTINKLNPQKYYQTLEMFTDDHTIDFDAPDVPEGSWASGFIAQEVADIPELTHLVRVPKNAELEYAIDYNSVHAYAIKAIQELLAKNIALEARVAALENK
tara:strand:+ start:5932 stop:7242 length:1311 start_codon:yes stop_codon:yes gene_type:complete